MSGSRGGSGLGGKVFLALLLAGVVGYLWACVEKGCSPLALLQLFSGKPEPAPPPPVVRKDPKPEPPPAAPKPEPVKPRPPEPAKTETPKPEPAKSYSSAEMNGLFADLDLDLRRGEIFKARERVQNTSRLMLPPDFSTKFADYEARVGRYHALLLETTKGGTVTMPSMTQVFLKSGGKLVVKVLSETKDALFFESITGIRGKVLKADAEEIKPISGVYAAAEVKLELVKKCGYTGLDVEDVPGKPLVYKDKPGRKVTGLQIFFDLADFCARNGANDKLIPLFDEALKRDPDLLVSVHEAKAERLVNLLLFFLGINSSTDAQKTIEILKDRYADTRAYQKQIAGDQELQAILASKRPGAVIVRADPKPAVAPPTAPPSTDPPKPVPVPAKPETKEIERQPPSEHPAEPTAVGLPEGTNAKVSGLVAIGDRHFNEAMKHLQNSDPNLNPDGWSDENKKALESFMKANTEGYVPAQDAYPGGAVPQALLDRVRETTMRSSLCRKRSVSTRK
jgi:hypothetical protein